MSSLTTEKKELKGKFTDLTHFVNKFGLNKYSIYTRNDGEKSLVLNTMTARGSHSTFISLSELSEVIPLIK